MQRFMIRTKMALHKNIALMALVIVLPIFVSCTGHVNSGGERQETNVDRWPEGVNPTLAYKVRHSPVIIVGKVEKAVLLNESHSFPSVARIKDPMPLEPWPPTGDLYKEDGAIEISVMEVLKWNFSGREARSVRLPVNGIEAINVNHLRRGEVSIIFLDFLDRNEVDHEDYYYQSAVMYEAMRGGRVLPREPLGSREAVVRLIKEQSAIKQ